MPAYTDADHFVQTMTLDPAEFAFDINVDFAWCPTDWLSEFMEGPPVIPEAKKKKRTSSGLNLLRPKSSRGVPRFGELQSCSSKPFGSFVRELGSPLHKVSSPKSPLPPFSSADGGSMGTIAEHSTHSKQGEWDSLDDADFFPHSVRSPMRTPKTKIDPSPSTPALEYKLAKPVMAPMMQWYPGEIRLEASGDAARDGGSFGIWTINDTRPMYHYAIAPDSISTRRIGSSGCDSPWEISDIQQPHFSVFNRHHVIAIRLCPPSQRHSPTTGTGNEDQQGMTPTEDSNHLSPSSGVGTMFGFRPRGQTFSGRGSIDLGSGEGMPSSSMLPERGATTPRATSSRFSASSRTPPPSLRLNQDKTFFFAFATKSEMTEWFLLFRSFARSRNANDPLFHRRLRLSVLDLTESTPRMTTSGTDSSLASAASTSRPADNRSRITENDVSTVPTGGRVSGSLRPKKGSELKPDWTHKGPISLALLIDGITWARTTWRGWTGPNAAPFWGENFDLEDLPSYSCCVLAIYQQIKGKAVQVAQCHLPLVSDIANPKDERYPVKSIVNGSVVGELRLSVAFHEIKRLPFWCYRVRSLGHYDNIESLYHLDSKRCLEGAYDNLARMDAVNDHIYKTIALMIDREVKPGDSILFRGNTPLTRLLESVMRLVSPHFLIRSLGPTIALIAEEAKSEAPLIDDKGKHNKEAIDLVWKIVKQCWTDMYAARGSLPKCLQAVFYHLFESVRFTHAASTEPNMPYKALSAFLFLRLIIPAILKPHLFGLQSGLYSPHAEKTAKLVAKIINAMSFFLPRESQRDPQIALFSDFIADSTDMVIDYLQAFCVNAPLIAPYEPLPPIQSLVSARILNLPDSQGDAIPVPTIGGPVDRQAEMALLSALVARGRAGRRAESSEQSSKGDRTPKACEWIKALDRNLKLVAAHSDPANGLSNYAMIESIRQAEQMDRYRARSSPSSDEPVALPKSASDGSELHTTPPPSGSNGHALASPAQLTGSRTRSKYRDAPFHLEDPAPGGSRQWAPLSIKPRNRPPSPSPSSTSTLNRVKEQAQKATQATGEMVKRSLSGKGVGRRVSASNLNMRIQTPGREADDKSRPRTARK